jgi:hypothetical protein
LISKSKLATDAKHAKVTVVIIEVTSCHDYKIVTVIQESSYQPITSFSSLHFNIVNKLHPYLRVLRRFGSVVTLQGKKT